MDVKDLMESLSKVHITPADTKMVVVCGSKSSELLAQIGNCNEEELTEILYGLYQQVDIWRVAIDATSAMGFEDRQRAMVSEESPVNTEADGLNAEAAISEAIKELGGIYVGLKKDRS